MTLHDDTQLPGQKCFENRAMRAVLQEMVVAAETVILVFPMSLAVYLILPAQHAQASMLNAISRNVPDLPSSIVAVSDTLNGAADNRLNLLLRYQVV